MSDLRELHDELRAVARHLLAAVPDGTPDWSQAADAGWLSLEVPEELEGAGASFSEVAVVLEELGRAAAAGPFLGTLVLGVGGLLAVTPTSARGDLLRDVGRGEARLAVALSGTGDPWGPPGFTLDSAAGTPVLRGRAEFVVDAAAADHLLLVATDAEDGLALVHVDAAAVAVTAQPLVDATRDLATVTADEVGLDPGAVWTFAGDPGAVTRHLADRAAVAVAVDSLGLGEAMLEATTAYVATRHQFDRPVGSFQAVKHACADMLVTQSVSRELVAAAVDAVAVAAPDAGAAVARAKAFATAGAVEVVGSALQLHGGIGYTWESGIHTYLKRAVLDRTLFGSPRDHRRRLAAEVLGPGVGEGGAGPATATRGADGDLR